MHRLIRLAAVVTALCMVMAGLNVRPAAAQDGLTSDTSYESPKFGYVIEWTSDWEALADFTTEGESLDSLRIYSEDAGSWIDFWGLAGADPAGFLETYVGFLEDSDSYDDIEVTEADSADRDAVAATITYLFGDNATPLEEYVEVRVVGDALVLTSIKAAQGFSLIAAILAMSQVTLDGDPIFPSVGEAEDEDSGSTDDEEDEDSGSTDDEEDEDTGSSDDEEEQDNADDEEDDSGTSDDEDEDAADDEEEQDDEDDSSAGQSGVDGDTYVGPTFGVSFEFDSGVWDVVEDLSADDNNGRDLLLIEHTDLPIRVYFETYDTVTRASDCLESASEEAYGDADVEIFEDEDGEAIEGSSRGVAYAAYLFENEDGDELVTYVECRALPGGAGVFVTTMFTFPDEWEDAFDELSAILDTVELEGGSSSSSGDDEEEDTGSSDDEEEDDSGSSNDEEENADDEEEDDSGSSADDDEEEDDDSGSSSAGVYESPTYGFTVEYDEDVWELTDDSSRRGTDVAEFENADDVILTITATEAGSRDDAESCVEDHLDTYEDVELIQVTNSEDDEPLTGETEFGFYTIMAYDDEDGETHALYIECGASPDEDFLVLFVADGPWDGASDMIPAVVDVIEAVEF